MKRLATLVTILFLVLMLVLWFFNDNEEQNIQRLSNQIERLKYENQRLEANLFYFNPGRIQLFKQETYSDDPGLNLLNGNEKVLVFRFDASHCNLCYEEELRRLKGLNPHFTSKNLIILTSFNGQTFRALGKKFSTIFPAGNFENMDNGYLNLIQESYNEPYYFVLEKDMSVHSFFFPDKALPNQSQRYFEQVINYF